MCIVEAMKLMNEIESEVDGRITKILVEDTAQQSGGGGGFFFFCGVYWLSCVACPRSDVEDEARRRGDDRAHEQRVDRRLEAAVHPRDPARRR